MQVYSAKLKIRQGMRIRKEYSQLVNRLSPLMLNLETFENFTDSDFIDPRVIDIIKSYDNLTRTSAAASQKPDFHSGPSPFHQSRCN
jgi:hypothetical protein